MHDELLALARSAAHEAGAFLLNERPDELVVETKSTPTDVVSQMDRGAEQIIVNAIIAARPDDAVLGEEGANRPGNSGVRWVIDPLDGTVNYLYRLPHWGVSIGVEVDGVGAVGVVVLPRLGVEYHAVAGHGAHRVYQGIDVSISASDVQALPQALIATGFNYDAAVRERQAHSMASIVPAVRDIRRLGAGAVDLCLVADGTVDGYFEYGLHPWDLCAGQVIAREAGAVVCGLGGNPASSQMVVAAGPAIIEDLVALIEASGWR